MTNLETVLDQIHVLSLQRGRQMCRGVVHCPECGEQAALIYGEWNGKTGMLALCPQCRQPRFMTTPPMGPQHATSV
jgi:hypothetical protein